MQQTNARRIRPLLLLRHTPLSFALATPLSRRRHSRSFARTQATMSTTPVRASKSPLTTFLQNAKPPFSGPIHAILGNEAADVDSLVCAIALAYAWQPTSPHPTVPVANIPREDLRLRPDAFATLRLAGLQPTDILFTDDFPGGLSTALGPDSMLTLVDHNELARHQAHLARNVRSIVDHHADVGLHTEASPRIMQKVGSCATLVADQLHASGVSPADDAARLLICAILLDTGNLSPAMGKATPRDAATLARLRPLAEWDEARCAAVYDQLCAARTDVTGFSARMLLRRDLKTFAGGDRHIAIASIGMSPEALAQRAKEGGGDGLAMCVERFAKEREVDGVALLLTYVGARTLRRDLAVMKGVVGDALQAELFGEDGVAGIGLERRDVDAADGLYWFRLRDSRMSRKVVAPLVIRALEVVAKRLDEKD